MQLATCTADRRRPGRQTRCEPPLWNGAWIISPHDRQTLGVSANRRACGEAAGERTVETRWRLGIKPAGADMTQE